MTEAAEVTQEMREHYEWKCGHGEEPPHKCPYLDDIKGDDRTLCRCCEGCQRECARDI